MVAIISLSKQTTVNKMIAFRQNDFDFKSDKPRVNPRCDVMVDGTRVATMRTYRQAKAFRDAIELDAGYPSRTGTQVACFMKYYRKKYGTNYINA